MLPLSQRFPESITSMLIFYVPMATQHEPRGLPGARAQPRVCWATQSGAARALETGEAVKV